MQKSTVILFFTIFCFSCSDNSNKRNDDNHRFVKFDDDEILDTKNGKVYYIDRELEIINNIDLTDTISINKAIEERNIRIRASETIVNSDTLVP